MRRAAVAGLLAASCLVFAPHAHANDPVAAEAAFVEGRALMSAKRYAEACPKLEASHTLEPAVGTVLNLAECFAKIGRTASAWIRYREAAAMALEKNQHEREEIARSRARELEPKLCRLTIVATNREGLVVTRDGQTVAPAALGIAVPVDPGPHVVEARAPSSLPF
ncbi:MAG: hypothetical protein K0S65_5240, partial [Labilithrix sp.]|nr:hypothetical protein [Labilithrix sp.]